MNSNTLSIEQIRYLPEKEVSQITGIAIQTLRNYRAQGKGMPYIKLGKAVRYSFQDVVDYMESRRIKTCSY